MQVTMEKSRRGSTGWKSSESETRRKEAASRNPTLLSSDRIALRVASFVFRFEDIEHLRECLKFFLRKTHPTSRLSSKQLESEFGKDWRQLRGWSIERWFERLPMYLFENAKRVKVVRALEKALALAESGKLKQEPKPRSKKRSRV